MSRSVINCYDLLFTIQYISLSYCVSLLLCFHVHVSYFVLQFKPEEIAAIMKDFYEPGTLAPTGLFLGGTKYMVIAGEPGAVIRGKKVPSAKL